ncbi:MAG TPA: hypothetical protein VHA12_00985 [Candidatus Nanoarchaeia archaeon]|nr:hypothetical protein [Candidatus Nanoarchaeia archaeon]
MGENSGAVKCEEDLLRVASFVCRHSPGNILLIGGGCVLSETAGFRRLRGLSDDLDFIVNDEGLDAVKIPLNLGDAFKNGQLASGGNVNYVNDILVGFFYREIKGWKIPEKVFAKPRVQNTSFGEVYMIPAELNLALKVRRGASREDKPHIYGKDSVDSASIITGMRRRGESFDVNLFLQYLTHGVCVDCKLSGYLECINHLKVGGNQLFGMDREKYKDFIDSCRVGLSEYFESKT